MSTAFCLNGDSYLSLWRKLSRRQVASKQLLAGNDRWKLATASTKRDALTTTHFFDGCVRKDPKYREFGITLLDLHRWLGRVGGILGFWDVLGDLQTWSIDTDGGRLTRQDRWLFPLPHHLRPNVEIQARVC